VAGDVKTKFMGLCRCLISGRQMIQMALSIATGLSHLHIEIIGTQVSLLFFCKNNYSGSGSRLFCESGSRLRPRIFYFRKSQKITVAKFLQFSGVPKFRIVLWQSRKKYSSFQNISYFFSSYFVCHFCLPGFRSGGFINPMNPGLIRIQFGKTVHYRIGGHPPQIL
jgi:hypothetical protein